MPNLSETKKENNKKKTNWEPKKSVMIDVRKSTDKIPWEPGKTVFKTLEESYGSRKKKSK